MPSSETLPSLSVADLAHAREARQRVLLLDVRRAPAYEKNPVLIPGAIRVPPEEVEAWAKKNADQLSNHVVAYCVYGHEVSQGAATALRSAGFHASYLEGGIAAWQEQGLGVEPGNA